LRDAEVVGVTQHKPGFIAGVLKSGQLRGANGLRIVFLGLKK
jgi:hypothetical protein